MNLRRSWILAALAAAVVSACAANPEDRRSASQGHESAAKTHREFARDYENAGNADLSRAVIRMSLDDAHGAIKRLHDHDSRQRMRQRQR
jgi:hypothetical protein